MRKMVLHQCVGHFMKCPGSLRCSNLRGVYIRQFPLLSREREPLNIFWCWHISSRRPVAMASLPPPGPVSPTHQQPCPPSHPLVQSFPLTPSPILVMIPLPLLSLRPVYHCISFYVTNFPSARLSDVVGVSFTMYFKGRVLDGGGVFPALEATVLPFYDFAN